MLINIYTLQEFSFKKIRKKYLKTYSSRNYLTYVCVKYLKKSDNIHFEKNYKIYADAILIIEIWLICSLHVHHYLLDFS